MALRKLDLRFRRPLKAQIDLSKCLWNDQLSMFLYNIYKKCLQEFLKSNCNKFS